MDTTLSYGAGHHTASSTDNPGATAPVRIVDRHLLGLWQYRQILRSPLLHPFKRLLRPLVRWAFQSHAFVYDGNQNRLVGVNLKPLSLCMLLLSLLLAPLAFVMLLPLLLILVPLAALFGMAGMLSASMQTDADEVVHHTSAWHLMH